MNPARLLLALVLCGAWDARAEDPGADLMSAAYNDSIPDARAALKRGAEINNRDKDGQTALMYAAGTGNDRMVHYLIGAGADVLASTPQGDTALSFAALNDRDTTARLLLEKGAAVDPQDADGRTPLILAAAHGSAKTAAVLLEKGADVNARNINGSTPLMTAVLHHATPVVQVLLDKGADLDAKDKDGGTALMTAAFKGFDDISRLLIDKGADVTVRNSHGLSALEIAHTANDSATAALIEGKLAELAAAQAAKQPVDYSKMGSRPRSAPVDSGPEPSPVPWDLAAAAAVGSLVIGVMAWRRRGAAKTGAKTAAIAKVRSLAASDPAKAYEALKEYENAYRDLSVFSAEELLHLYEVRDSVKRPAAEATRRASTPERRRAAEAGVRGAIENAPQHAFELLAAYEKEFGDRAPFTGAELRRIHELAHREGELLADGARLTDAQVLGLALSLSEQGRHADALALVAADPWLGASVRLDDGCEGVILIHDRAGQFAHFLDSVCAGKNREFQLAYARALLLMDRPDDCLRLMKSVRVKERDGRAIEAAALAEKGKLEEAAHALGAAPMSERSFEEWSAFFQISLRGGRIPEALDAYDHIKLLRPLRRDPKLYHAMARACESVGQPALAGEIYDGFVQADLPFRDAYQKARALDGRKHCDERIARKYAKEKGAVETKAEPGQGRIGKYDIRSQL